MYLSTECDCPYLERGHYSAVLPVDKDWILWSLDWICSSRRLLFLSIDFRLHLRKIHGLLFRWGCFVLWWDSIFRRWHIGWDNSLCLRNSCRSICHLQHPCRGNKWHCPTRNSHRWDCRWGVGFPGFPCCRYIFLVLWQPTMFFCRWDRCFLQRYFRFGKSPVASRWLSG